MISAARSPWKVMPYFAWTAWVCAGEVTAPGSALLPAAICAALWIAISYATGGSTLFSLGGGILIGVIVFMLGQPPQLR
jgi:hypothetical protein